MTLVSTFSCSDRRYNTDVLFLDPEMLKWIDERLANDERMFVVRHIN
jgi:hypothetical protein